MTHFQRLLACTRCFGAGVKGVNGNVLGAHDRDRPDKLGFAGTCAHMGIQNDVPVFHATDEDMADSFGDFIEAIDARLAGPGICKIVPPPGWTPRRQGYSKRLEFDIPQPIRQIATGSKGLYRLLLVQNKPLSLVNDFRPLATHEDNVPPANDTPQDLERRYWRSLSLRPPLYGADVEGSLFDKNLKVRH